MKKSLLFFATFLIFFGVHAQQGVATLTDSQSGTSLKVSEEAVQQKSVSQVTGNAEVIWQKSEAYAIGADVYHSDLLHKVLVNWSLNDSRIACYNEENNVAEWEFPTTADFTELYSNESGSLNVVLDGSVVYFLDADGQTLNTINLDGEAKACAVRTDGEGAYIGITHTDDTYSVEYYSVMSATPIWSQEVECHVVKLALPENDIRLIVCHSEPLKAIRVFDPTTGEMIQDGIYYYDNSPTQAPALSANGDYMTFTDFSGYATLMHWNGDEYEQVWRANVSHAEQSSTWGCGNAISADGSYIAIGTLGFIADGYDGSIFLFNNYSATPIWEYYNAGDEVPYISMSDDGSLIACAAYGPLDNSASDLLIFRRQSNVPFVELSTPGSMCYVDIAGDGSTCITAGKAVHARAYGYGGNAYLVRSVPTTCGNLDGTVTLNGTDDFSGATVSITSLDDYYETTIADGSFTLKYIPAGTYSVTISKTGYEPQNFDGVIITAGETANINVTLEPVGAPISNLYASKGASYDVQLRWDAYQDDFEGYAIYRKESLQGQYGEPLAVIGTESADYIDDTAIPTMQYYYAVTAVLADDLETPFSNIDLGYVSTSFLASEIDVYDGAAPNIDGEMSAGEWDDAFMVDVSDFLGGDGQIDPVGTTVMYFKANGGKLYVAVDNFGDTELSANDCVAFYVDDNGDGVFPASGDDSEGNYWMKYTGADVTIQYRPIYAGGGVGTTVTVENPELAFSDATGHVVVEFALEFGTENHQINPGSGNKSNLYLYVRSNGSVYQAYWPYNNTDTFDPVGYQPINYHVEDEIPPAPENLHVDEAMLNDYTFVSIDWNMPEINDFDHFNVYVNSNQASHQVTGTELILDVEENTDYSVFVTIVDHAGNESAHSETLTFHVGYFNIDEIDNQIVKIYPNPASSIICIESEIEEQSSVTMTDITGRIMRRLSFSDLKNISIDVNDLQSGVYFVMIQNGNIVTVRKIVKE